MSMPLCVFKFVICMLLKDVSSPLTQVDLGSIKVPCNPDISSPSKVEALAVASENFIHSNGHSVRSYMLLIKVSYQKKEHTSQMCNGNVDEGESGYQSQIMINGEWKRIPIRVVLVDVINQKQMQL